jgi:DNA polymerase I-like protein with 3'-5' exonuclease and polymerase domains
LPDLRRVEVIGFDTETEDDRLRAEMGSGWPFHAGHICGLSVAYRADGEVRGLYFPIRHPDTQNFDPEQIYRWVRDHIAATPRFVTQNGLYDWGWLRKEAGIKMPPGDRLEEIGALATMVDENRFKYSLDALCAWRGLPGKDDTLLRQGIAELGLVENKRKKLVPQTYICQLPARYVGPYAEADAVNTLRLFENLDPVLDREGTRAAYRLECDILPMVQEMRLRGIRVDLDAAERARDLVLRKRDAALTELSQELGYAVSTREIHSPKWLVEIFDRRGITYPRTAMGNPSFTAGKLGWMTGHAHWLPRLIAVATKYNKAAVDFLQGHILEHTVNGRLHAEINPHRSEDSGTKSFRFSYSNPPLQQMPSRDEELAPLIRGVFLPEEGEIWAKPDASQQEFRLVVHYANQHNLRRAADAVARYRDDPDADFHALAAMITGLDRSAAKAVNFAKIYGAGVRKFGLMIGKPLTEAQRIYEQYDHELPFLHQLSDIYSKRAHDWGYITLYDDARRHFNQFAPGGTWGRGTGPCESEEARRRQRDPAHPWYRQQVFRVDVHTALNALIQGSAARHTKLWMRAVWREGIVPLLQMHDCLDCSVSSREQAELVARLGCEAVQLDVPMRVDVKYGRTWGDANQSWEELQGETAPAPNKYVEVSPLTKTPDLEISPGPGAKLADAEGDNHPPTQREDVEHKDLVHEILDAAAADLGDGRRANDRPPWTTPLATEALPGSAGFAAILAVLSAEDRTFVWPAEPGRGNRANWSAEPASAKANRGEATANSSTPLDRARWLVEQLNGDLETGKCLCPVPEHGDRNPSFRIELGKFSVRGDPLFKCNRCPQETVLTALAAKGWWPIPLTARPNGPNGHTHHRRQQTHTPDSKELYETLQALAQPRELAAGYFQRRGLQTVPDSALIALFSPFNRQIRQPGTWFCVRNRAGDLTGLHVIWLDSTLTAKREAEPRKQSFGKIKGNFILLGTIDPGKPLIIAEGVETALAVIQITGFPAALVGCGSTTKDIEPPDHSAGFIIAADHDA